MRVTPADLAAEVSVKAQRGRGPGGQNVNKVASCALVSWDFESSPLLTDEQKARLRERLAHALNAAGQLQVRSDEFRELERNRARALEKMAARVSAALAVPKKRKPTSPTPASRIRRQQAKVRRSQAKKLRRPPQDW
jgi:ribosome-associated protein